jgi:hypothetical protein
MGGPSVGVGPSGAVSDGGGMGTRLFVLVVALAALVSLATASPSAAAPCVGIRVEPGDKLQRIISAACFGATISFAPGIYELPGPLYPRQGRPLGARRLTRFEPLSCIGRGSLLNAKRSSGTLP